MTFRKVGGVVATDGQVSDESLMRRVQGGDEDAFKDLFSRHVPMLRARIRRGLPAAVLRKISVADLLQETRIVAFQRCGGFEDRGPGSVRKWLDRIAQLKVKEAQKHFIGRAKRGVRHEVTRGRRAETAQFVGGGHSPSKYAMANELEVRVRRALARLKPEHLEVLRLAREEQLTFREVGEQMSRSAEAARKLYARALAALAAELEERNGDG